MKRGPKAPGFDPKRDLLFVGLGATAVAYYRCFLPAMALGCDWVGIGGEPPESAWVTGLVGKESKMPNMLEDYKAVILQQPHGKGWNQAIENMREAGVKVIYEVDDYLHGIPHLESHDFKKHFDKEFLWNCEQAMKRCDALIASTEWIRGNYSHFARNSFVCENGIDLRRYDLTKPDRPTVNVGWAGGTGHAKVIVPWLQATAQIMGMRPDTCFVSIGQGFAEAFATHFPRERAIAVPWAAIEQYPAAMTMMDIGIAPGGKGGWWRGKSDLRWLEAGALEIPLVANPDVYPSIEHGVTGFHAHSPQEAFEHLLRLVDDSDLRTAVGREARRVIEETRSIEVAKDQWVDVVREIIETDVA